MCTTSAIAVHHLDHRVAALVLLQLFHPWKEIRQYLVCELEKMINLWVSNRRLTLLLVICAPSCQYYKTTEENNQTNVLGLV